MGDYQAYLEANEESITEFKTKQQNAFDAERDRWDAAGLSAYVEESGGGEIEDSAELPEGIEPVESPVAGSVWKVLIAEEGCVVEAGATLAILESMKMEIVVEAPISGKLVSLRCKEGQTVSPGHVLFGIEPM